MEKAVTGDGNGRERRRETWLRLGFQDQSVVLGLQDSSFLPLWCNQAGLGYEGNGPLGRNKCRLKQNRNRKSDGPAQIGFWV